jgi:hypothetical protein
VSGRAIGTECPVPIKDKIDILSMWKVQCEKKEVSKTYTFETPSSWGRWSLCLIIVIRLLQMVIYGRINPMVSRKLIKEG